MIIKYPCRICKKAVGNNHKSIQCDICDHWVHIKCNHLDNLTYEKLKSDDNAWFCKNCSKTFIPFSQISDLDLSNILKGKNLPFHKTKSLNQNNHLENLFKSLNEVSDMPINCNYMDINEFNKK